MWPSFFFFFFFYLRWNWQVLKAGDRVAMTEQMRIVHRWSTFQRLLSTKREKKKNVTNSDILALLLFGTALPHLILPCMTCLPVKLPTPCFFERLPSTKRRTSGDTCAPCSTNSIGWKDLKLKRATSRRPRLHSKRRYRWQKSPMLLLEPRHIRCATCCTCRKLRGARRDRDTNDLFAHCSLIFYFLDIRFSNFVFPSELHPFIWFFFRNSFRKKKNIWKTTQNALAPSIFTVLSIVLKLGTPLPHTQAQNMLLQNF